MCGIAGIWGSDGVPSETVNRMLALLQHRGPDAASVKTVSGGAIGHTRLSIIDLRAISNQPFESQCGRFALVFNGEIYNYRELRQELEEHYDFRTSSDTEVLLAAYLRWGEAALERLQGMFAFAIWDSHEQSLFAARDRFGVKPFFYSERAGTFSFASEIKALWAAGVPKRPNERVWAAYLARGAYRVGSEVFWKDIVELPAGWMLRFQGGQLRTGAWYPFEDEVRAQIDVAHELSDAELMERTEFLLRQSVRLRLQADVPVSVNLSGGLDSSLLLALILREGVEGVTAYSFCTGDERYDELPWIQRTIKSTGLDLKLTPVLLTAQQIPELAERISAKQDEPFGGVPTLAYAKLFQSARIDGRLVLLDGQGLDEAWAGYDYYQQAGHAPIVQGSRTSPVRPNCLTPELMKHLPELSLPRPFEDRLRDLQWRDLRVNKLPRALRFNDRISMAFSTELREPFLHHELVELGVAARVDHKIRDGVSKWAPRTLAHRLLDQDVALAPKRPVQTPQREWLRGGLRDWVRGATEDLTQSSVADWFDPVKVRQEMERYLAEGADNSFFVWQWVNTALLFRSTPSTFTS